MKFPYLQVGAVLIVSASASAQVALDPESGIFIGAPADGPRIRTPRLEQADIEAGEFTLRELRRRGLEFFTTPFNKFDGHGDGPVNAADPSEFGGRPTANGTWLRLNGLDSQTCLECHAVLSNATIPATLGIGGIAGISASAFPGVTEMDVADTDGDEIANVNGRLINPPFLFGSGGVELLGKEMTQDLQDLKAFAQANPGTPVALDTKGVNFGTLTYDAMTGFDTSAVEGIDDDLVVRPFGRKGEFTTVRQFDVGAMQFHLGMQAEEAVGTGVDADGDGVVDEIKIGELSALHIFNTNLERPKQSHATLAPVLRGQDTFDSIGCADCHVRKLFTDDVTLNYSFPEVADDPSANVFFSANLTHKARFFRAPGNTGLTVELFSDLKRHDMGPDLAETTGHALDAFFVTPRLWGIGDTAPYLHDGRALTLRAAITSHGGEGTAAASNFDLLSPMEQEELLLFLDTLRVPRNPAQDIATPRRM